MAKYTFEQINPAYADLTMYFDGDCFRPYDGDYTYTLFIIPDKGYAGINLDIWNELCNEAEIDSDDTEGMIKYLATKTGKEWDCVTVCGYCQGDVVDVVYCPDGNSKETAKISGELYLGCGSEFKFVNDGEEVYGYYVADCQTHNDEETKKILCNWEGISPVETDLILVDGVHTVMVCDYRTV